MHKITGISVVIPHFGDPDHAIRLVRALQLQVDAPPVEIIVVDDHSPQPFPSMAGVKVASRNVNGGFGSAVNTGATLATQDFLLVLNSDLTITPSFVSELVNVAQRVQPAIVSPAIFDTAGNYQWVGRNFPHTRYYFADWLTGLAGLRHTRWWHRAVGHNVRCVPGEIVMTDWVIGAVMLLPLETFRVVDGFDQRFFMNCEEIDLQRRFRDLGVRSVFAGTVSAVHVGGGSSNPQLSRQWLMDSRLKYAHKWNDNVPLMKLSLRCATFLNFGVNFLRQIAGRKVNARAIFIQELSYLRERA